MKILIVSSIKRLVRPDYFASRSRVIFQIAEGLAKRGHEVTLLGTGDSKVPGVTVVPVIETAWIDMPPAENEFVRNIGFLMLQLKKIQEMGPEFDIIHNHTYPDFLPAILSETTPALPPIVTTLHAVHDYYMDDVLSSFPKAYYIALSDAYQRLYSQTKFFRTVYNGVNTEIFPFHEKKDDYLFWLGRMPKGKNDDGTFIDPKGVRWAIKLAQETNSRLYISCPVEDINFYKADVAPHLNEKIQFVGAPTQEQSVPIERIIELYQNAKAFLMTINQHEPFGLVMAEAMSCGTPVIAFDRGSAREVIKDGETGFIVPYESGISGLKDALSKVSQINPRVCREHVVKNFSIEAMVASYESAYQAIIDSK